jgi:hypothetical protein
VPTLKVPNNQFKSISWECYGTILIRAMEQSDEDVPCGNLERRKPVNTSQQLRTEQMCLFAGLETSGTWCGQTIANRVYFSSRSAVGSISLYGTPLLLNAQHRLWDFMYERFNIIISCVHPNPS